MLSVEHFQAVVKLESNCVMVVAPLIWLRMPGANREKFYTESSNFTVKLLTEEAEVVALSGMRGV